MLPIPIQNMETAENLEITAVGFFFVIRYNANSKITYSKLKVLNN